MIEFSGQQKAVDDKHAASNDINALNPAESVSLSSVMLLFQTGFP